MNYLNKKSTNIFQQQRIIKNKLFFNQNKIVKTICPWHYRKHACNYLHRQRKAMGSGNKLLDQPIKTELNTR